MSHQSLHGLSPVLTLVFSSAILGCVGPSSSPVAVTQPLPQSAAFSGQVLGNNHPVVGAAIQMYAASNVGYGSNSVALLSSPALTDATGKFTITGYYTCPGAGSEVYLSAVGGSAGSSENPTLALIATLGNCGDISSSTTVTLNELTTVAAVWPLAQFMTGLESVGTSATNQVGLHNAFLNSARLVNSSTGTIAPSDAAIATAVQTIVPSEKLNTLANILASCVGSSGSTATGSPCGTMFTAPEAGTFAPTDTVEAALSIAQHPSWNVNTLYSLNTASSPFSPALTAAPVDWLLPLTYQYDEIYGGPGAADGIGNYWVVGSSYQNSFLVGLGQTTESFHNYALLEPGALTTDQNQNLWVTQSYSSAANGLFEFSPSSSAQPCGTTCGPLFGGGLTNPVALAVDASGNIWVRNDNGVLSEFASNGTPISPASGYVGLGISDTSAPYIYSGVYAMAFDPSGALWIPDEATNSLVKITPATVAGAKPSSITFHDGGLNGPYSLVIDHSGSVWVGSSAGNTLTKFNPDGSVAIQAVQIGGACELNWMTVDGAGTVWTSSAGNTPGGICEITSTGSVLVQASVTSDANGDGADSSITVDASGSLWEATGGYFYSGARQYLGAAVPTGASLADALRNGTLATRP